ncbi:MAG TPA: TauD/TfdA family dioxygenase, partial [Dongiaceae bacterium]|nr:TauD/TfdA family dioxygenase [Dongiaceae bacterium]
MTGVIATAEVTQLHPFFVGELRGVDVRALDEAGIDRVRALMDRYAVLVVRDQPFVDADQVEFARRLGGGEIVTKVGRSVIDHAARLTEPGMTDISNLDEKQQIMDRADRRRMYSLGNRLWHTDSSFQDPIARYSML